MHPVNHVLVRALKHQLELVVSRDLLQIVACLSQAVRFLRLTELDVLLVIIHVLKPFLQFKSGRLEQSASFDLVLLSAFQVLFLWRALSCGRYRTSDAACASCQRLLSSPRHRIPNLE